MAGFKIEEYDEFKAKLNEIKEKGDFDPDVSTKEGYEFVKRYSLDVGKVLKRLEDVRTSKKAYYLKGGKEIDSQAKEIREELEGYQLPHKTAYKELDSLKKEREAQRKETLEIRVRDMKELPESMADSDSDGVLLAMETVKNEECLDFYEYTEQALKARNHAREKLGELYAAKLKAESEAIELDKLRAEKEARDKADHEEAIRREASAKAEKEKAEAIQREQQAKQDLIDAKAEADASARKAKIEAEERAIQARIDSDIAVEAARVTEVNRQAELVKAQQAEVAAREADKKYIGKILGEIKVALMDICDLNESKAKDIVIAIRRGDIPNISVKY